MIKLFQIFEIFARISEIVCNFLKSLKICQNFRIWFFLMLSSSKDRNVEIADKDLHIAMPVLMMRGLVRIATSAGTT
jgi:hypothetical protein